MTGRARKRNLSDGRLNHVEKVSQPKVEETVDRIWKENPHMKITKVRKIAANELGVSDSLIIQKDKRHKKTKKSFV